MFINANVKKKIIYSLMSSYFAFTLSIINQPSSLLILWSRKNSLFSIISSDILEEWLIRPNWKIAVFISFFKLESCSERMFKLVTSSFICKVRPGISYILLSLILKYKFLFMKQLQKLKVAHIGFYYNRWYIGWFIFLLDFYN